MTKERLPQNMTVVLQEIGENSVLFYLYLLTLDNEWTIFKNLKDKGCDLILQKFNDVKDKQNKLRIEVKTRQKLYSTSKKKNFERETQFNLSESEYDSCDFLVGYWFDKNAFFIVPKQELKPVGKTDRKYRFTAKQNKNDEFPESIIKYLNNWDLIKEKLI